MLVVEPLNNPLVDDAVQMIQPCDHSRLRVHKSTDGHFDGVIMAMTVRIVALPEDLAVLLFGQHRGVKPMGGRKLVATGECDFWSIPAVSSFVVHVQILLLKKPDPGKLKPIRFPSDPVPKHNGKIFSSRDATAKDGRVKMQILMIELFDDRLQNLLHIVEIDDHTRVIIHGPFDRDFQKIVMSMTMEIIAAAEDRPGAFVRPGRVVVAMRRAEFQSFGETDGTHITPSESQATYG